MIYKDLLFGVFACLFVVAGFGLVGFFMVEKKHPHIKILNIPACILPHQVRDRRKNV